MSTKSLCPICKKVTELGTSNVFRPFCCKRCRLIDLGQWIDGTYSISETDFTDNYPESDSQQKH